MRKVKFAFLLSTLAIFALGCGGGKPYDPGIVVTPPTSGFALSQPGNQVVVAGDTVIVPITVSKTLGEDLARSTGDVSLTVSGVPDNATTSFSVNPVTPTISGMETLLSIETDPIGSGKNSGISDQTFTLTVTGDDGNQTHSVSFDVTVVPFGDESMSGSVSTRKLGARQK
jgi:hypothetical protein